MYSSDKTYFYGTGRRKKSVARVRLLPGTGKITINDRDIDDYFGLETLKLIVRQPMALTETLGKFDIVARVAGGGFTGQAGAIRHGLSRALLQYDESLRPTLKKAGFLTRDPRMKKERSTVSKQLVAHRSSPRDNFSQNIPLSIFIAAIRTSRIAAIFFRKRLRSKKLYRHHCNCFGYYSLTLF